MDDEIYDVVDEHGTVLGQASWTEVHTKGLLHQTACVLVYRDATRHELLLQQRSDAMHQMPGRWQHSAGGHVLAGMSVDEGARRELAEELFTAGLPNSLSLHKIAVFLQDDMPNNRELVSIYEAFYPGPFAPDSREVGALQWVSVVRLRAWLLEAPDDFTPSFRMIWSRVDSEQR